MSAPAQTAASAPATASAETSVERTSGAFGSRPGGPPKRPNRLLAALRHPFRDPDAILLKELRATFRTPGFIRFLYLSTALVGLAVVGGGAAMASGNTAPAEAGRNVFEIFFSLLLGVLCLVAPGFAATAITSEREARTYESLLLSGMSGTRIVLGKLAAYYASVGLVVVAIAPVVAVAFLFGGTSPLAVLVGFAWILMVLGVAVSFGIAVSAHVQTTRVAIVITTILAVPTAMMLASLMTAFGEGASSLWGVSLDGPFWFAHAFAQRVGELDTWMLLGFAPLYVFGMPTWFFVASAIAGVVPPSDDRSTALKIWALAAVGLGAVTLALPSYFLGSPSESGDAAVAAGIGGSFLPFFIGLVLCNEPPLPPAPRGTPSLLARVLGIVGPGAAGTLRFTIALSVLGAFLLNGVACLAHHLSHPSLFVGESYDEALLANAVGLATTSSCFAALAVTLRLLLRNGGAARVLSVAAFGGVVLAVLILLIAVDTSAFDRVEREVHPLLAMTPMGPVLCAVVIAGIHDPSDPRLYEHWSMIAVAAVGYGFLTLAMWGFTEVRAVQARRMVEERKRALEGKLSAPTRPAEVPPSPQTKAVGTKQAAAVAGAEESRPTAESDRGGDSQPELRGPSPQPSPAPAGVGAASSVEGSPARAESTSGSDGGSSEPEA